MTLESGNAMAGSILSEADVDRLLIDPSPENRVNTAAKLAEEFGRGALTDSQRKLAEEIFRLMGRDAEVRVTTAGGAGGTGAKLVSGSIWTGKGLGLGLGLGPLGPVLLGVVAAAAVYAYWKSRDTEAAQSDEEIELREALT